MHLSVLSSLDVVHILFKSSYKISWITSTDFVLQVLKIWEAQKYFGDPIFKKMLEITYNAKNTEHRQSGDPASQQFSANAAPPIPPANSDTGH